jgi:hypothetical protein
VATVLTNFGSTTARVLSRNAAGHLVLDLAQVRLADHVGTGPGWLLRQPDATRLVRAHQLTLEAPTPDWLSSVDVELTGRPVRTVRVAEIGTLPGPGWTKPANLKVEAFHARWRTPEQLTAAVRQARLPDHARVQWSPTRLRLTDEVRCYVLHGQIVTSAVYRTVRHGRELVYGSSLAGTLLGTAGTPDAVRFATDAVAHLGTDRQPRAYVLDVGFDAHTGRWVIIEANPAWNSMPYSCNTDQVLATVLQAAHAAQPWVWDPDDGQCST